MCFAIFIHCEKKQDLFFIVYYYYISIFYSVALIINYLKKNTTTFITNAERKLNKTKTNYEMFFVLQITTSPPPPTLPHFPIVPAAKCHNDSSASYLSLTHQSGFGIPSQCRLSPFTYLSLVFARLTRSFARVQCDSIWRREARRGSGVNNSS